jgi:tripartite-type tricarboxylate transporter receptor subunit TctC
MAVIALAAPGASAHAYPDRPLKLIVPFPATGTPDINGTPRITKLLKLVQTLSTPSLTDTLAQDVANGLSAALEQSVQFERKSGGMTLDATRHVVRAAPDGHTLLFAGNPTITIYPTLFRQFAYDPLHELAPVAQLAEMPIALVSDGENPARTLRQVIERARFVPGQVNFAALGEGTTSHLAMEAFCRMVGIQTVRVSYNGSTPALNAVATRNVEFGFVPLTAVLPFLGGGKVRIIAISSGRRHPAVPKIPTIAESGFDGFEANGWFGVFAPARTPGAIVSLLNYDINRVLAGEDWQRNLITRGLFAANTTPEEFRKHVERDSTRWSRLLTTAAAR